MRERDALAEAPGVHLHRTVASVTHIFPPGAHQHSIVPRRPTGAFSAEAEPPAWLFSVRLCIDQAYSVGIGPGAIALVSVGR